MEIAQIVTDELQVTQLGLKLEVDYHEIKRIIAGN